MIVSDAVPYVFSDDLLRGVGQVEVLEIGEERHGGEVKLERNETRLQRKKA